MQTGQTEPQACGSLRGRGEHVNRGAEPGSCVGAGGASSGSSPDFSITCCGTLGKSPSCSLPQFPPW